MGKEVGDKGQVTMFVIVAIVLLFIFSFLIFVANIIQKAQISEQADLQVEQYLNQNSIKQYVTSCLDIVSGQAMATVAMQGGVANFSGKILGKDYVTRFDSEHNRSFNISIAIFPNENCPIVFLEAPAYPYPSKIIVPGNILEALYAGTPSSNPPTCKYDLDYFRFSSGFFGYNLLPRLCNWNGTNRLNATSSQHGLMTCSQRVYTSASNNNRSVQEELEWLIAREARECINFSHLPSAGNVTVEDAPKASVTFGDYGAKITLTYPFKIRIGNKQPITYMVDFAISKPVAFKELYDYVFTSAFLEVTYADFRISQNTTGHPDLAYYYKGYTIERIPDIAGNIDLVKYVDGSTKIESKSLVYQFAIKNRRPALDYIHTVSYINEIDVYAGENETLTLTPQGYDPDDDSLVYNYSGWLEDYDESYNYTFSLCNNPATVQFILDNCMVKNHSKKMHNWTNSTLFKMTKQNASYNISNKDAGIHTLRITVREEQSEKLIDYQDVIVYVYDSPQANITGNNTYADITDERITSIEDPYILSGLNSKIGFTLQTANPVNWNYFKWNDSHAFGKLIAPLIADRNKTLHVPADVNSNAYDLQNIKSLIWNNNHIGLRNVTLLVNTSTGLSDTAIFQVNVTQCLPHRSNDRAYPYNLDPSKMNDSFQANHTCCFNYNYSTSNTKCYTNVTYGSIYNFTDNYFWNREPMKPTNTNSILHKGIADNPLTLNNVKSRPLDNDIYNRSFERTCSGDRGNVCSGNALEVRKIIQSCADNNGGTPDQERCSGPPIIPSTTKFSTSATLLKCVNYTGSKTSLNLANSFEKYASKNGASYSGDSADGACNIYPACGNYLGSDSTSKFAMCDKFTCGLSSIGKNAGNCSTPLLSSCQCSASCGSSDKCYGRSLGDQDTTVPTCKFGNNNYEDICSNCGLLDKRDLNGRVVCKSSGEGCNADSLCNGKAPKDMITDNMYCDDNCQKQTCTNNFAYNALSRSCHSAPCTDDSFCASGFQCCTTDRRINGQCSSPQVGQCVVLNLIGGGTT